MKNSSELPEIYTDRLVLRRLDENDRSVIFLIRSNKEIAKYLDRTVYKSEKEAAEFITKINNGIINKEWFYWAICKKNDGACIGTICLWNLSEQESKAEIGFELLPDYQRKGYMTEAAQVVIRFGFEEIHLHFIEGEVDPHNSRSIQLLKKIGFELKQIKNETTDKQLTDVYILGWFRH